MFRRVAIATLAAAVPVVLATSGTAVAGTGHSSQHVRVDRLIPATKGVALPTSNDTVDSLNWAGYAVTGSGITAVNSTFTVPTAGLVPPGFTATWAGIGGYNTSDLIQAGTAEQSTPIVGGSDYYAWYEILPAAETPLTNCTSDPACTVTPGDNISVDIHNTGGNNWTIAMTDAGHWSWSTSLTYASTESSAEWIQEAPSLGGAQTIPAPVGSGHFGPTSTWTSGAGTKTIAAGNPIQINEGPGLVNLATASALGADGQSFNVCTYAQTCAAP